MYFQEVTASPVSETRSQAANSVPDLTQVTAVLL